VRSTNFTYRRNYVHEIWGEAMNALFLDGFHFHDNVVRDGWSVNIYLDNAADGLLERNYSYKTPGWRVSWTPKALAFGNEYYAQFANPRPIENITIKNNIFANAAQVMLISQRRTNNFYRNVKFLGNTFYNNALSLTAPTPGGNVFRGNIMDGGFSVSNMAAAWTVSHNAFPRGNVSGANALSAAPMFVNPGAGTAEGFKLQAASALKGKGVVVADLTRDFGDASRRTPPTLGAFE
jgi:hypothetical protein